MLFADEGVPGFRSQDWPWWAIALYLAIDKLYPYFKQWFSERRDTEEHRAKLKSEGDKAAVEMERAEVEIDVVRIDVDARKHKSEIARQNQIIHQWERFGEMMADRLARIDEKWDLKFQVLEKASRECEKLSSAQAVTIAHQREIIDRLEQENDELRGENSELKRVIDESRRGESSG